MDENLDAGVESEVGSDLDTGVEEKTLVSSAEVEDTTDWKAVAEAEAIKAENYKTALTQKRQLRNTPLPVIEEDEDKPITRKELEELLQSTVVPLVSASKEDTLLSSKITDPAKRAYVKQLLDTRIVRTGTSDEALSSDIDAALAIADSHKKDKVISELQRAAANRPQTPSAGSSNEAVVEQKQHKWTAEQARELDKKAQALGVDPEKFKKDAWTNRTRTNTAQ